VDGPPAPSTGPDATPLLELRGVDQAFALPGGQSRLVLQGISLQVRADEVVALLGPSGCGKSTILRILAGLVRPTAGEVLAHGRPLQGLAPGVAIVFQGFALLPWMTVSENIRAVLRAARLPDEEIEARIAESVRMVGLAGFEGAYPRELSGGMKQRVGMARAFSVRPEVLLMDEPFSQVDALTAESLRAELIDIWSARDQNPSSVVLVSHDIKEVAYLADRIVVLGANPGSVRTVLENPLPRPRDLRSPGLARLVDQLHDLITGSELPDLPEPPAAAGPAPAPAGPEVLPQASASEVVGLVDYLDARGGAEDVFRIAAETGREFGQVLTVVKAAELLDLVDTPRRQVVLTAAGRAFVAASPGERKASWRRKLLELRIFADVQAALLAAPRRRLPGDFLLETIVLRMPSEDMEKVFATWVGWARYGELFAWEEGERVLELPGEASPAGGTAAGG
jgi:NitT/TauT family transport system ATP-binding protein